VIVRWVGLGKAGMGSAGTEKVQGLRTAFRGYLIIFEHTGLNKGNFVISSAKHVFCPVKFSVREPWRVLCRCCGPTHGLWDWKFVRMIHRRVKRIMSADFKHHQRSEPYGPVSLIANYICKVPNCIPKRCDILGGPVPQVLVVSQCQAMLLVDIFQELVRSGALWRRGLPKGCLSVFHR
jgi:hypothetical protein